MVAFADHLANKNNGIKNGYEVIVSNETLFEVCISIAKGNMNEQELAIWQFL